MPEYSDASYDGLTALALTDSLVFLTAAGSREGTVADILTAPTALTFNTQTGNYTLVLADANDNKIVAMNVGSANTVTVPPNASVAFPVGAQVDIIQMGAGQTTIVEGSGVTVNRTFTLTLAAQHARCVLLKTATNTWVVSGEMALS